jgi:light-regulated signal transduction histidine kinase (bacteriophytochrome)
VNEFTVKMSESKRLIELQRTSLDNLNKGLEKLVAQRTATLEQQNEMLKKHAFYNAHLLRGPFCRVKGLIELQLVTPNSDNDEIRKKLNYSLQELDSRIKEIQRIVDTTEVGD